MPTKELKELYKQRGRVNAQISNIESAERVQENLGKVGKTFIYRNGYNHTETWPLYVLVLSIDENGYFTTFGFETDTRGKTSFGSETRLSLSSDYREIDREIFDAAWDDAVAAMDAAYLPRTVSALKQPNATEINVNEQRT